MKRTREAYLGLGTNLGDRLLNLTTAEGLIYFKLGPILEKSRTYETDAWGKTDQAAFLNKVIKISTALPPEQLLREIHEIEAFMGRERKERWGPRLIDIDILYYHREVIDTPDLTIPHPRLQDRKFVLIPLSDFAPDLLHPVLGKDTGALLRECRDTTEVRLYNRNEI